MKKLQHKLLYMKGVKKRVGDIKSIFQNIEYSLNLLHTSLISTNNCVILVYSYGHIIIYTHPQDSLITVEFLYPIFEEKFDKMQSIIIDIFSPLNHNIKDINLC